MPGPRAEASNVPSLATRATSVLLLPPSMASTAGLRDRGSGRGSSGLLAKARTLIPAQGDYEHNWFNHDTNSHAHMRAALIGSSETIPFVDGRLALGTWQQVVLIDFDDRPRSRTVTVQVLS